MSSENKLIHLRGHYLQKGPGEWYVNPESANIADREGEGLSGDRPFGIFLLQSHLHFVWTNRPKSYILWHTIRTRPLVWPLDIKVWSSKDSDHITRHFAPPRIRSSPPSSFWLPLHSYDLGWLLNLKDYQYHRNILVFQYENTRSKLMGSSPESACRL
jgi:hypothetical protein